MVMQLKIKRIQTDSGLVLGSYDPDTDRYRSFDRPSALMHFVRVCVNDLFRPRINHQCGPECKEPVTLVLGAPFHPDLTAAAPP